MQLWTDYEGVTIDGAFPLKKLLLPEGRSAFFSTAGPNGEPTVVRLIECHFDEEEILARWHSVKALNHPNFLKFEHYGQIELDGGPVVYAVFEKVDANLADVLSQGHLTVKDVTQLASSLVAALDMLHTHGFVHEHIEPRNIFAVNDVVKLRSDCIREAPEAEEGCAAKQRDVRDLATVLLQALTQQRSLEGIPDFAIPPPFNQIIRNGLNGTNGLGGAWRLEDIRAALEGLIGSTQRKAPKSLNGAAATPAVPTMPAVPATPDLVAQKAPSVEQNAPAVAARPSIWSEAQFPLPLIHEDRREEDLREEDRKGENRNAEDRKAKSARTITRNETWGEEQSFSLRYRWLGAAAMVALLLLLSAWILAHTWNAHRSNATQSPAAAASQPAAQSAKQISTSPAPASVATDPSSTSRPLSANSHAGWRVIPFTYNRKTDAEKKAASLARNHPELQPAVFTPSGHAPYLVSIGGVMDRDTAYALARRSRSLGLPHDTYAQNYSH